MTGLAAAQRTGYTGQGGPLHTVGSTRASSNPSGACLQLHGSTPGRLGCRPRRAGASSRRGWRRSRSLGGWRGGNCRGGGRSGVRTAGPRRGLEAEAGTAPVSSSAHTLVFVDPPHTCGVHDLPATVTLVGAWSVGIAPRYGARGVDHLFRGGGDLEGYPSEFASCPRAGWIVKMVWVGDSFFSGPSRL